MQTTRLATFVALAVLTAFALETKDAFAAGTTIVELADANFGSESTSLALGSDGSPVIAFSNDSRPPLLSIVRCSNQECTSRITHAWSGEIATNVSLALDPNDNPVVAYEGYGVSGTLKLFHCGTRTCDFHNTAETLDGEGSMPGGDPSLVVDAAGVPVISYQGASETGLKIRRGNTVTTPDPGRQVGSHSSLVLDASGNPVVSYFDGLAGALKVLHCGDSTCQDGNVIASPDGSSVITGLYSSIALDSSGNPVVSYSARYPDEDLKLLHCGDPNCSSGNSITSPDTEGDVGTYSSLALDGSGYPVISYRAGDYLKLLHCGDGTCTSNNAMTLVDTRRFSGRATSLALDEEGNPVISYYGGGLPAKLRLLRCADSSCSTPKIDPACDGVSDARDVLAILRYSSGIDYTVPCPKGADVNLDGAIDAVDASLILQFLAGVIDSLPTSAQF